MDVKPSPLIQSLSGKFHGSIFLSGSLGTRLISNNWFKSTHHEGLQNVKANTATASKQWAMMSNAQQTAWYNFGLTMWPPRNGYNAFQIVYNQWYMYSGVSYLNAWPPYSILDQYNAQPFTDAHLGNWQIILYTTWTLPVFTSLGATAFIYKFPNKPSNEPTKNIANGVIPAGNTSINFGSAYTNVRGTPAPQGGSTTVWYNMWTYDPVTLQIINWMPVYPWLIDATPPYP